MDRYPMKAGDDRECENCGVEKRYHDDADFIECQRRVAARRKENFDRERQRVKDFLKKQSGEAPEPRP